MVESAREYHEFTSYTRHDMGGGRLDWGNQPGVFKTYPGLGTISLPEVTAWPAGNLSAVLGTITDPADFDLDLESLSRVLLLTHSLTAKTRHAGADFYYRNVASAGALYPFELYVAAINVAGLDQGLYHQNVKDRGLTMIRSGDISPQLSLAVPLEEGTRPVLVFFLTSIFFRSSWKYRDRGYRYNLLDTGHLAENLCLAANAEHLPFRLIYDFDDSELADILRVDSTREACLAIGLVESGEASEGMESRTCQDASDDLAGQSWVSTREADYPVIHRLHSLSCRIVKPAVDAQNMWNSLGVRLNKWEKIEIPQRPPEVMSYAEAVFKRRSMRNFVRSQLPSEHLGNFLRILCADPLSSGGVLSPGQDSICVGFLAGNVQGMEPGFYILDTKGETISLVASGFLMDQMASACLGQAWLANCSLHFLFMSNLALLERTAGPRGYRHAMLAAGRLGQRIYLAATSMKMGCCGIGAFYDAEASGLLGLNEESVLLYLVATGPVKRWSAE
ncbi:MAG: SagB/ThcOx family dehydrogenase [Desulfomonile tiedjei]|nr:SagB/ThcOx family dehydrogenase [Desulfomonile tiedjei]